MLMSRNCTLSDQDTASSPNHHISRTEVDVDTATISIIIIGKWDDYVVVRRRYGYDYHSSITESPGCLIHMLGLLRRK